MTVKPRVATSSTPPYQIRFTLLATQALAELPQELRRELELELATLALNSGQRSRLSPSGSFEHSFRGRSVTYRVHVPTRTLLVVSLDPPKP